MRKIIVHCLYNNSTWNIPIPTSINKNQNSRGKICSPNPLMVVLEPSIHQLLNSTFFFANSATVNPSLPWITSKWLKFYHLFLSPSSTWICNLFQFLIELCRSEKLSENINLSLKYIKFYPLSPNKHKSSLVEDPPVILNTLL